MKRYELLCILNSSLTDEVKEEIINKYVKIIEDASGKIFVVNKWGNKKLEYPINYKHEGFYVLVEFECNSDTLKKIHDLMRIDENILRYLITTKNITE